MRKTLPKLKKERLCLLSALVFCCTILYVVVYTSENNSNSKISTLYKNSSEDKNFNNESNAKTNNHSKSETFDSLKNPVVQNTDENESVDFQIKDMEKPEEDVKKTKVLLEQFIEENISNILEMLNPSVTTTNTFQNMKELALRAEKQKLEAFMQNANGTDINLSMMDKGDMPIQNIILTTWRSGSTFLGEGIANHPAMFYHYEPLLHFEIVQVRDGELAEEGLRVIRNLLKCDYSDLQEYINFGNDHHHLHSHNSRLWDYCSINFKLCMDNNFLSKMCKIFPAQIMKTVRMRLRLAETLLNDPKLNVRILLLIRDPRGTIQSRKQREWCSQNPDCFDPDHLCADMVDDYHAASIFREKFPDKFEVLRYEDISLNPYSGVKQVLSFFRLEYHPLVDNFIKTHTVQSKGGVSSTFRDSKSTPFRWLNVLINNTKELQDIQNTCKEALELWGYAPLEDFPTSQESFIPLLNPPWPEMTISQDYLEGSSTGP